MKAKAQRMHIKYKILWILLAIALAFLVYHAPRLAQSLPLV